MHNFKFDIQSKTWHLSVAQSQCIKLLSKNLARSARNLFGLHMKTWTGRGRFLWFFSLDLQLCFHSVYSVLSLGTEMSAEVEEPRARD